MAPRTSQTRLAVLGALTLGPDTGYGIRAAITTTLGHFWHESFGQIYPTLDRLLDEGCVRRRADGRFALTRRGAAELRRLLAHPLPQQRPRNALLLRLFFASRLPEGAVVELLTQAREDAREAVTDFERIEGESAGEEDPDAAFRLAALRYGLAVARATADWADSELGRLPDG